MGTFVTVSSERCHGLHFHILITKLQDENARTYVCCVYSQKALDNPYLLSNFQNKF